MITEEQFVEMSGRLKGASYPDGLCVMEGTVPVLVSVPHCLPHLRNGKIKTGEGNTDVLGFILHEQASCHLFVNAGMPGDPNDDEAHLYKDRLAEYVASHGIGLVLDLHGAASSREFDFELGTAHGRNISGLEECVDAFVALASLMQKNTTVDTIFPAAGANRISSCVKARTSVPSLQIEINKRLRCDYATVTGTAAMLVRYVNGIVSLLKVADRKDYKLLWVCNSKTFMPRNLAILNAGLKDVFRRNDNVDLLFAAGTEEFVVKGHGSPDGCVCLTGQMISRYGCAGGHVLLHMRPYSLHSVLKPQAEDIDNVCALVSDDLYEKYKDYDLLEVLNPFDNLRSFFRIRRYEGNVNGHKNAVWLSYYQRKLLGLEVPHMLSNGYMIRILERMTEEDAAFFKSQFKEDDSQDCFVRLPASSDDVARLKEIWTSFFGGVRFRGVKALGSQMNQNVILEKLIGTKSHQLRAARCTDNNEVMDAVFITRSSSIVLGVSELDYLWITHEGRHIRAKVVIIDKEDYMRLVAANTLKSIEDLDMLVCIPSKLRLGLGIYEPGTSVRLERSVKDIFRKNAFSQMMTLLGLFIAIATLPEVSVLFRAIVFVVLGPVILYSVLAEERNKVK